MKTYLSNWLTLTRHALGETQTEAALAISVPTRTYRSWEQRAVLVEIHDNFVSRPTLLARLALWSGLNPAVIEIELGLIPSGHHPITGSLAQFVHKLLVLHDGEPVFRILRDGRCQARHSPGLWPSMTPVRDIERLQARLVANALEDPTGDWTLRFHDLDILTIEAEPPRPARKKKVAGKQAYPLSS